MLPQTTSISQRDSQPLASDKFEAVQDGAACRIRPRSTLPDGSAMAADPGDGAIVEPTGIRVDVEDRETEA